LHPLGSTDPVRDVRSFETELIFGDLEFVEKRLERMDLASKKGKKHDVSSRPVLFKCREALEKEISLRNVSFTDEEKRIMSAYQFLSTMPEIIVLNIGEEDINADKVKKLRADITDLFMGKGLDSIPSVILLCGKIEMEIAQLPGDEAKAFLDDLGIDEPAMNRLCRVSYDSLGLMSFFTVGSDEVKAWTIKKGTEALYAAGKIHSDIERGFIRAEVVGFDDYISSDEDMVKARGKGLVRLEGKTYAVKDGDIINFKFNV
ncbi:MAG TPA: redox-regulated ATPase YchF, partial [Nitrospirae bacterium]|nr:redox-regulated ATPase YchF [Nitrospirota bacterium]